MSLIETLKMILLNDEGVNWVSNNKLFIVLMKAWLIEANLIDSVKYVTVATNNSFVLTALFGLLNNDKLSVICINSNHRMKKYIYVNYWL